MIDLAKVNLRDACKENRRGKRMAVQYTMKNFEKLALKYNALATEARKQLGKETQTT
jgi:hypothetical protein